MLQELPVNPSFCFGGWISPADPEGDNDDNSWIKADDETAAVALTDHGHLDEGGHGGDTAAERTARIWAAGSGVPAGITSLDHAGFAVRVLNIFGVEATGLSIVPSWEG